MNKENLEGEKERDLIDWDACIENPPKPYYSKTIRATFRCIGRSKPIPIYDNDLLK